MISNNLRAVLLAATCGSAYLNAQAPTKHIALRFQPMVGHETFACGRSYANVGTTGATLTPSDFAFYVHNVSLISADGREVPVALDQDGVFQNGSLALLDFEDGTGPCSNGNTPMHTEIAGAVPEGKYTGVKFTIGVPFERNHADLASQPSPLSVTRMFWAWNSGHKFLRFDSKSAEGKSWVLHLGSTGCMPTGSATTAATSCSQPNRMSFLFSQFNVDSDVIIADAAALFANNGGAENQVCMSSLKSAPCSGMFNSLGVAFNEKPAIPQKFLRIATEAAKGQ